MKKSYYAIIPANVRYDRDLRANSKLLYGEITALCNEKGFCWASNSYFAELYEVTKETISRWISQLADKGYVTVDLIYKEGTNQIINRYIRISHGPIDEIVNTPIDEKVKGNTTVLNTTVNNTSNTDSRELELFNHYLSKDIIQHQKMTSFMRGKAKTALREHSMDHLKEVIDNYAAVYKSDKHFFDTRYTFVDVLRPKDINQFSTETDPLSRFKKFDKGNEVIENGKTNYVDDVGVHGVKLYK